MLEREDFSQHLPEIGYRSVYAGFVVNEIAMR
jgi:hypothetical protein